MGTYLSKPKTEKVSEDGENHRLRYGVSSMQGWRLSMEDAHAAFPDLDSSTSFFAVYDGHGGKEVAKFCAKFLHKELLMDEAYQAGDLRTSFPRAFLRMDEMMRDSKIWKEFLGHDIKGGRCETDGEDDGESKKDLDSDSEGPSAGCTACAVLIRDNNLIVANAGDSRCIMSKGGRAYELSKDHKPELELEQERISKAGGFIYGGRVNGTLNLTRAIGNKHVVLVSENVLAYYLLQHRLVYAGDMEFKRNNLLPAEEQIVTANPDVNTIELSDDAEFIVLACDGIWDCMTSQELVDFVHEQMKSETKVSAICERVFDRCVAPTEGGEGCDNMTMILVQLKKSMASSSATED